MSCAWCSGKGTAQTSSMGTRDRPTPDSCRVWERDPVKAHRPYAVRFLFTHQPKLGTCCPQAPRPHEHHCFISSKESAVGRALDVEISDASVFQGRMDWPPTPGLAPSLHPRSPVPHLKEPARTRMDTPADTAPRPSRPAVWSPGHGSKEAHAIEAGFGSLGWRILKSGVLVPQSVAQKGASGPQLGTSHGFSDLLLHGEGAQPDDSHKTGLSSTRPDWVALKRAGPSCLGVRAVLSKRQRERLAATKL